MLEARNARAVDSSIVPAAPKTAHARPRVGILIVAYNAVTTLAKVLNRIPVKVWENVEEVVVFDDASQDATYELGIDYKDNLMPRLFGYQLIFVARLKSSTNE